MNELMSRAFRAYFTTAKREGYSADQPSEGRSSVDEIDDKTYVTLQNGSGVLAVYRVRNDGMLKRLRRWPAELGEAAGGGYRDEWRNLNGRRVR